jgi:hypothetical protein
LVQTLKFRIGTAIERKIEQSVIAAMTEGTLLPDDLIEIATLFGCSVEGEPSFWVMFENFLVSKSSSLSDDQLLKCVQAL